MNSTSRSDSRVRTSGAATRNLMVSAIAALAFAAATLTGCVAQDGPLSPFGAEGRGPHFDESVASTDSATTSTDSTAVTTDTTVASGDTTTTSDSTVTPPDTDDPSSWLNGQLLVCPNNKAESVAATIGPEGGVLAIGNTRVQIPEGAVKDAAKFVLTIPASAYLEIEMHAVGVEHYEFRHPVTMSIDYSRCPSGQQRQFRAWYIDTDTKELLEEMGGVTDTVARTHVFQTPHLSGYAVGN